MCFTNNFERVTWYFSALVGSYNLSILVSTYDREQFIA